MTNPLEKLLQQDAVPKPDPSARRAAREAALAEFARAHATAANEAPARRVSIFQVLSGALRLSRESNSRGSDVMPWYSRRMYLAGAASVCLAIFGGTLAWNSLRTNPQLASLERAAPVAETPAAEPRVDAAPVDEEFAPPEAAPAEPAPVAPSQDARELADRRADASRAERQQAREAERELAKARQNAQREAPVTVAEQPATPGADKVSEAEEVVVTGTRRPVQQAMEMKRDAIGVIDSVSAPRQRGPAGKSAAGAASPRSSGGRAMANVAPAIAVPPPPAPQEYEGRDRFEHFDVNAVKRVAEEPVSTFSVDVDTASYSFVRRQLQAGVLPQKDAVRVEEMINYFDYSWPAAETREQPFKPTVVVSDSPWRKGRKLVTIGIKGYEIPRGEQPDANLVLLMDVSGSMSGPDRLPLAIQSMELLLGSLKPTDTVAIVVYAGAAGKVLDPTPVRDKEKILEALHRLQAGGSTAGAAGIKLAYELAESSFRKGGMNRVLLATDGDFNVGIDSTEELKGFVERQREKGIFLSVLGYGMGNYHDQMAQALAQNGNGVAAYIDSLDEARKVLVEQATGSLFTIAKDVKLQVEFNEDTVSEYRLVGYETRALKREDFNNDAVDAGDVGAGHTVTAIYEITPVGSGAGTVDRRRYGREASAGEAKTDEAPARSNEYGFLKIRYKLPDGHESILMEQPIEKVMPAANAAVQRDVQFSTAVAGFAQLLRGGKYTGKLHYDDVIEDAEAALGSDSNGHRAEFVQLVRKARTAKGM